MSRHEEIKMSHEIDMSLGKPAFVYDAAEGGAWHGLGVQIPEDIAKDPAKIAALVGAGYAVKKTPVQYEVTPGVYRKADNRIALIRDDTGGLLEILSDNRYNEVQPVEYFEA